MEKSEAGSPTPHPSPSGERVEQPIPPADLEPPPPTTETRTGSLVTSGQSAADAGPPPEPRGEFLTSPATAPMARLVAASTKEDVRARAAEIMDLHLHHLHEETHSLRAQVKELTSALAVSKRDFHESD